MLGCPAPWSSTTSRSLFSLRVLFSVSRILLRGTENKTRKPLHAQRPGFKHTHVWYQVTIFAKLFYFSHTVVIVTKADERNPVEVLESSPGCIKDLPTKVNTRCLAFNNLKPNGDQREKLFETVSIMLACNDGRHYSSGIYTQVATRLQAYGSGRMYSLRALADNKMVMLGIVGAVIIPALSLGYMAGGIALATCFLTKGYEHMMGPKK